MGCCNDDFPEGQVTNQTQALLNALNLSVETVDKKFAEFAAAHPGDLGDAAEKAKEWFDKAAAGGFSPAVLGASFAQAWHEWASGKPGYNPHHAGLSG